MVDNQNEISAQELVNSDSHAVSNWLEKANNGEVRVPNGFNWHALAEVAAVKARLGVPSSNKPNVEWARIAVTLYDRLAASAIPTSRDSFMFSSMMLRASVIADLGPCADDSVLDPALIIAWFFQQQVLSYDEVTRAATSWRELPVEQIRELRATKNRLNVISILCKSGRFIPDETLRLWLGLRHTLP